MGMASLDFILGSILILCFIYGMLRGFLLQLVALAALLIGLGAAWLVTSLPAFLFRCEALSAFFVSASVGTLVFTLFYLITRRRGKKLIHAKALAFSKGIADRVMGGIFSLVKGMIVILLIIWVLDYIQAEWREEHPRARELWDESLGARWAHHHNPIAGLTPVRRLKGFLVATRDPEARRRLHGQPAYERMLADPRCLALRDDSEVAGAISRGDWISALNDSRFRALLADEAFWLDFSSVRWEMAIEKAVTPAEVHRPGLTPLSAHSPASPEARAGNLSGSEPPGLSGVVLKTGAVLHGAVTKENPEEITIDLFVNGGVITMSIPRREIERMERPGPVPGL